MNKTLTNEFKHTCLLKSENHNGWVKQIQLKSKEKNKPEESDQTDEKKSEK